MKHHDHHYSPYLLFMLTLSIVALLMLAIERVFPLDAGSRIILTYADTVVCVLFFIDFLVMFYRAKDKRKYLLTWGWLDLASSIPTISILRWCRAARIMRIFRVLRGVRAAKILTNFILERRAESAVLAATLVTIILVAVSSVSILHFEAGEDGNIKTPEDAAWWSVATITTASYGDKYPVTTEGKMVAATMTVAGVGLLGMVSGLMATWFLKPGADRRESEIQELRREIGELKDLMTGPVLGGSK